MKFENIDHHKKVFVKGIFEESLINKQMKIMRIPFLVILEILAEIGERAIILKDPKLDALMCKLSIYSVSDPECEDYDSDMVREIIERGYRNSKLVKK